MKSAEGTLGRIFILKLEDGDTIPDTIEAFAAEKRIESAFVAALGGIGSGKLIAGPEDGDAQPIVPMVRVIENVHEAAAVGTIFPAEDGTPRLHMHAALGRDEASLTGCVRLGLDVWKIGEVVILEILGLGMERKRDPLTGFEILSVR